MRILLIEDDSEIVETVALALLIRWPEAKLFSTHLGREGIDMVEREKPDMVILDLGLPDISGFEVLKQIRLFSQVPIVILTVRMDEADIVKGLEMGADDYITKPFRQMEFLARVKAALRKRPTLAERCPLVYGPYTFDPYSHQFSYGNRKIALTATEARIIHCLMENGGHVVSQSTLAENVWGGEYPGTAESLRVHIRRLRQKIENDPDHPQLILTKPGVGYLLVKPSQPDQDNGFPHNVI